MSDVTPTNEQVANPNAPTDTPRSATVQPSADGTHWDVTASDGSVTQWSTRESADLHVQNLADPDQAGNASGETTDELRLAHRMKLQQDAQKLVDDGVA